MAKIKMVNKVDRTKEHKSMQKRIKRYPYLVAYCVFITLLAVIMVEL